MFISTSTPDTYSENILECNFAEFYDLLNRVGAYVFVFKYNPSTNTYSPSELNTTTALTTALKNGIDNAI